MYIGYLKESRQGREGVPTVGIVVTDGISKDPGETKKQANLAKDMGVNMFAVGVARKIDYDELNAIASNKKQVVMVDSFDELAQNIGKLVKLVCPGKILQVETKYQSFSVRARCFCKTRKPMDNKISNF